MNSNPRCPRCQGPTYRSSQTCFVHGDMADVAPVTVENDVQPRLMRMSARERAWVGMKAEPTMTAVEIAAWEQGRLWA
jgi:hypothetical protein